jgi:hypothetical protein
LNVYQLEDPCGLSSSRQPCSKDASEAAAVEEDLAEADVTVRRG